MSGYRVVICGGGIAGIEALLRLRRLAGDAVDIALIAPNEELRLRPAAVLAAFGGDEPPRVKVGQLAADAHARWVRDALAWVDRPSAKVHTAQGDALGYDALLLAVGGTMLAAQPGLYLFSDRTSHEFQADVVRPVEEGAIQTIVFAVPAGPSWPIPVYELALLTSSAARRSGKRPRLMVCTPQPEPLPAFGGPAADALRSVLDEADIELRTGTTIAERTIDEVVLQPGDVRMPADIVVTVPQIDGPNIRGIPGDGRSRFLRVDAYCKLIDASGALFAAGDATNQPVKHGSVGAQQADEGAAGIAHAAGLAEPPGPLRPIIRAELLTGGDPLYLTAHLSSSRGWYAEIHRERPWRTDAKVVAEELDQYL